MKTEYSGIEISYDEGRDKWLFDLRGRSRSAESLAKAKEAIDKEPKEKRTQSFPRFEAYHWSYNNFGVVIVTSVADDAYYGQGKTFWVVEKDGKRKKERDYGLFPVNDHNTAIVNQILEKEKEAEKIAEKISNLRQELQKATVPAEIAA
jgi:hypothetical protein